MHVGAGHAVLPLPDMPGYIYYFPFLSGPPGLETTFDGVSPGYQKLRVVSSSGRERASFSLVLIIPENTSFCTVHLINTGVTVNGRDSRVEFTGVGPNTGFLCSLDGEPPSPCKLDSTSQSSLKGSQPECWPTHCNYQTLSPQLQFTILYDAQLLNSAANQ